MFLPNSPWWTIFDIGLLLWLMVQITLVALLTYAFVVLAGRVQPASRVAIALLGLGCMTALPIIPLLRVHEWSWGEWLTQVPLPT